MSEYEVVEYHYYCPKGVQRVLACGTSAFIGEVDTSTVLKYSLEPGGDMSRLKHEHKILSLVGQHPRIIAQKGFTDAGLYLERAANETVFKYLTESDHTPTLKQRVSWCREVTEAVDHIHSKGVIHCDIQPTNILVDENLHLKLADFQGNYVLETGEVVPGWSGEPCRYFCPREDEFEADLKTDIFALGSTIHFLMTSQEVFPDIVGGEVGWQERIQARFASGVFPKDPHPCDGVTLKCWSRQYISAGEVLEDIRAVETEMIDGQHHWVPNADDIFYCEAFESDEVWQYQMTAWHLTLDRSPSNNTLGGRLQKMSILVHRASSANRRDIRFHFSYMQGCEAGSADTCCTSPTSHCEQI
jgi:hypothetical protein